MSQFSANPLRRSRAVLGLALSKFRSDNGLFLASALAFNLLLYFIPLALLMISLLGYTVLDSERAMSEVQGVVQAFLPRSQQALAGNLSAVVADRGLLGFVGFASFLVLSTLLFGAVRTVLSRVFQVPDQHTFFSGMAVDLLVMGLSMLLLLLVVITTSFLTLVGTVAEQYPSWGAFLLPGVSVLGRFFGVGFTALLLFVLYRFAPTSDMSTRALLVASLTGTLLFQIARWGFAWYVRLAQDTLALYGALGGVMFLFVWLYYASVVFILGAEVGWAYDQTAEDVSE